MTTGDDLKAQGIAEVSGAPQGAPWRAVATDVLLALAADGQPFTSEDITAQVGQPGHPAAVGALLNGAARRGWIIRDGFRKAQRANQHAALISVWLGTDAAYDEWRSRKRDFTVPSPVVREDVRRLSTDDEGRLIESTRSSLSFTVTVEPRKADAPARTAPYWICQRCFTSTNVQPPTPTLIETLRVGKCIVCQKTTTWRRESDGTTAG